MGISGGKVLSATNGYGVRIQKLKIEELWIKALFFFLLSIKDKFKVNV